MKRQLRKAANVSTNFMAEARSKYVITGFDLDISDVLIKWTWLIGTDKSVVDLTKMGDAILVNSENKLFFLDTGNGTIEELSISYSDYRNWRLSHEELRFLFLSDLLDQLILHGLLLTNGKIYSYTLLPLVGGEYNVGNVFVLDILEHFQLTGDLHYKMKDLPNGTSVEFQITD